MNYSDETGLNTSHYEEYKYISSKYNLPIFIFFVDEMLKEIYGNFLHKLEISKREITTKQNKKITLFKMENMIRNIYLLKDNEIEEIKRYNTRNYEYLQ